MGGLVKEQCNPGDRPFPFIAPVQVNKHSKPAEKQLRRFSMPIKNAKELFVLMLSDVRQGSEKSAKVFQELSQMAQDDDIKQALEARIFVSQKVVETLDQCFTLIGEHPAKLSGPRARMFDALAEDFRKEIGEIQDTRTRRFYVLARLNNLVHLRAAEYKTLIAAADLSGNYGVATLLETCLADKLALAERTQRWIRRLAETELADRIAAKKAA
jgi:ferritin-like metal-binding protein YciE